jgi:protein-S-isoprenylcysteine O-methyltransferase Ste14
MVTQLGVSAMGLLAVMGGKVSGRTPAAGVAFAVRPETRQLVTTGFYAKLRHPICVFGTMAFLLVVQVRERSWLVPGDAAVFSELEFQ